MAGIFDRVEGNDKLHVHLVTAALVLNADGEINNAQTLTALNNQVTTPLDAAAETDLVNLKAQILAQSGAGQRAEYMHKLESMMLARASREYNNEAGFRAYLGIA